MKAALNSAVALAYCFLLLAGDAVAQTESNPAPPPGSTAQPFPGIIVTPPRPPPQSCPDTGHKLELVV